MAGIDHRKKDAELAHMEQVRAEQDEVVDWWKREIEAIKSGSYKIKRKL